MPSTSRTTRAKKEVDDIDLSFLHEDEDILAVTRRSPRAAKGKAATSQISSPRGSQRQTSRPTSAAVPSLSRASTSTARQGDRKQGGAAHRRGTSPDSFIEEDHQAESSSDGADVDDIIASINGTRSCTSSSRAKQTRPRTPRPPMLLLAPAPEPLEHRHLPPQLALAELPHVNASLRSSTTQMPAMTTRTTLTWIKIATICDKSSMISMAIPPMTTLRSTPLCAAQSVELRLKGRCHARPVALVLLPLVQPRPSACCC